MSHRIKSQSKLITAVAVAISGLALILILYVLSVGPACAAMNHDLLGHKFFYTAYGPLIWLMENCSAVEDLINRYTKLFP